VQRPHFLMLAAAVMYARQVMPPGKLETSDIASPGAMLKDIERVQESLSVLNAALGSDQDEGSFITFREARASTQRMKSRQTRFEYFARALTGEFSSL
jgi:hypothetical protein